MDCVEEVLKDLELQFQKKNQEYATPQSRWANFTDGAVLQGETPEQVLLGYTAKQIVNLFAAKSNPQKLLDVEFINEKAGDIAVYMIILMAMVREKSVTGFSSAFAEAAEKHEELSRALELQRRTITAVLAEAALEEEAEDAR